MQQFHVCYCYKRLSLTEYADIKFGLFHCLERLCSALVMQGRISHQNSAKAMNQKGKGGQEFE